MHNPDSSDHPELAIYGVAPASSPRSLVDILRATITAHPDVAA
ncbi:MAG: amino acid adenylation protein, partial [Corynebacterium marinum]|nr:amino acid adenylation protein [Corynebacterium marinum]